MKTYEKKLVNKFNKDGFLKIHLYNRDFEFKISIDKRLLIYNNHKKIWCTQVELSQYDDAIDILLKMIKSFLSTYKRAYQLLVYNTLYYYDENKDKFIKDENIEKYYSCNNNENRAIKAMKRFLKDTIYNDWYINMSSVYKYNHNKHILNTYYKNW